MCTTVAMPVCVEHDILDSVELMQDMSEVATQGIVAYLLDDLCDTARAIRLLLECCDADVHFILVRVLVLDAAQQHQLSILA